MFELDYDHYSIRYHEINNSNFILILLGATVISNYFDLIKIRMIE